MDQTTGGCPTYESWTVRRAPWLPPFGLERRHDRNRESPGASRTLGPTREKEPGEVSA
ncbi:MAG: hypothetical protein JWP18_1561 [Solirubrobacterales bacterium]|nr:hypothetical protein [Solirubrobacterales bacterium]